MTSERRRYTPEFKGEALRLVLRGDRSVAAIARELGIHAEVLRSWVRRPVNRYAADDHNITFRVGVGSG